MIIEENWGVSVERIQKFFLEQTEAYQKEYGSEENEVKAYKISCEYSECLLYYKNCRITLTAVEDTVMNKWKFDRTQIRFEGPQEDVEEIYQKFFLRFLSAGG